MRLFRNRAEANRQAVPAVDRNNGKRQIDQFFVAKMLAYFCIHLAGHMVDGNQSHSLRPC